MGLEETDSEHRTHCDKCFNFKQCVKLNSLKCNEPTPVINCPITVCRFNCAQVFHYCKQSEHESLCPKVIVPCLNNNYGCPNVFERWMTSKHLKTCPASVCVCTMEWNRWPLPAGDSRPFEIENNKQLDVAFLKRDERTVAEWKLLPRKLRNTMKNSLTEVHPPMPLGISGQRIPQSIIMEKVPNDNVDKNETEDTSDSEHEDSYTPWGSKRSPPGLLQSVCNKLTAPEQQLVSPKDQSNSIVEPHIDINCNQSESTTKTTTSLNIIVDVMPRPKLKHRDMYTFLCGKEYRRDEIGEHFSNLHGNLSQLNGQWLFRRCPMASAGCDFGLDRMKPYGNDNRFIYNEDLDSFCVTQTTTGTDVENKTEKEEMLSLCDMPFEILVYLTRFLDPLSLNALSMTNTRLRTVSEFVVVNRGIVVLQWEKLNHGKWEVLTKKWLFSTSFSPIRKWNFDDIGGISNHMMTCSYYNRNVAEKPFCYPISISDL